MQQSHLSALRLAIDKAEQWRGSLMPEDFQEFDDEIRLMREALKKVRDLVISNRKDRARLAELESRFIAMKQS